MDISETDSFNEATPYGTPSKLASLQTYLRTRPKAFYGVILALAGVIVCVSCVFIVFMSIFIWVRASQGDDKDPRKPVNPHDEKAFFAQMNRITSGPGTFAEAYWDPTGEYLVGQAQMSREDKCDEIYTIKRDGSELTHIDNYDGITTCAYFVPSNPDYILYSSTLAKYGKGCPPKPDRALGYIWPLYNQEIYVVDRKTREIVHTLTKDQEERCKNVDEPNCYDAEGTISRDGETMVFTSSRSGDLELYSMNISSRASDGHVKRLTFSPGYDGGAFFSNSGKQIVWRAYRPKNTDDLLRYKAMLDFGVIEGINQLEIYVMNADGSGQRALTKLGASSFAPNWLPDDSGIIFSSNFENPTEFHLYTVDLEGKNMRRITQKGQFNGFPMFSPDGKYLAFSSNRDAENPYDMHLFIAEWKGFSYAK